MPIQYKQRRNDKTFIKGNERVTKETEEVRNFCRQYAEGVKIMTRRRTQKSRHGSLPFYTRSYSIRGKTLAITDSEASTIHEWLQNRGKANEVRNKNECIADRAQSVEAREDQNHNQLVTLIENIYIVRHKFTVGGFEYLVVHREIDDDSCEWLNKNECPDGLIAR